MTAKNLISGVALSGMLILFSPQLVPQASLGSAVPGVTALPSACGSTSFPNTVLLTSGTTGIYACLGGSWVFIGPGGGSGTAFGTICNNTVATTTFGQLTIASGCTLGSSYKQVFLNGQLLFLGPGNDYSISGNNILLDSTNRANLPIGSQITIVE